MILQSIDAVSAGFRFSKFTRATRSDNDGICSSNSLVSGTSREILQCVVFSVNNSMIFTVGQVVYVNWT
jgi:hypothetical protein